MIALIAAAGSAIEMALLFAPFGDPTRVYDGTDTRAFALLIGAALALAWPEILNRRAHQGARRVLGDIRHRRADRHHRALWTTSEYETFLYRGGMVLVRLSAVLIAVTIHPGYSLHQAARRRAAALDRQAFVRYLPLELSGHRHDDAC